MTAPSSAYAGALLTEFVRLGVSDIVVAPGSRSQALALAAAELDRVGAVRLHVRFDERVAGFLALGLSLETGRPTIVVTTSGTAVAELHPAVLEAHHSGVPLILLTADRPEELHGIAANQTTTHIGAYGDAVRRTFDVGAPIGEPGELEVAAALAAAAVAAVRGVDGATGRLSTGPVHVNVAFTEPLSSAWTPGEVQLASVPIPEPARELVVERLAPTKRTVVIAGSGAGAVAEETARALDAPLFAEVASGARFGPNLAVPYREIIRDEDFLDGLERIIVYGRPTLSREVPWLIARGSAETIVVRSTGAEDPNPGHTVTRFVDAIEVVRGADDESHASMWLGPIVAASRAHLAQQEDLAPDVFGGAKEKAQRELAAVRAPITRRALVEAVWRATWPQDRLVLASSRLVRVLDQWATGKRVTVHANRGLAGIDGNTATALGVALASQLAVPGSPSQPTAGVTRLLTGDLAFLHDVGALALPADEPHPRIQIIVGNDHGGTIFDDLEVAQQAGDTFDRVMLTPQQVDIERLAAAYGWSYRRVEKRGDLDPAFSAVDGPTIVEVPLDR